MLIDLFRMLSPLSREWNYLEFCRDGLDKQRIEHAKGLCALRITRVRVIPRKQEPSVTDAID